MKKEELEALTKEFLIRKIKAGKPITTGNINSTYLIEGEQEKKYILQRINKTVFTKPEEVMQNIRRVSRYLERQVLQEGGDPSREVLHPISTLNGTSFVIDENGEYWRMYDCIEGARTYDTIDSPETFYKVGKAFGRFQNRLSEFPIETLHEAIPDFHNTPKRFTDFELAILADKAGRLQAIKGNKNAPLKQAIDYLLSQKEDCRYIVLGKKTGSLPVRVTHNDTKINNVMIDDKTGEAICVIDLDTVGPDSILVDYGDAIRSGCNKAGEEAEHAEDVKMDLELYRAFTQGFMQEVKDLNSKEIEGLVIAPRIITIEQGMRFLTDYLNGDTYFKLKPNQPADFNFTRAINQIQLAKDMKQKEEQMKHIVKEMLQEKELKDDGLER